MGIRHTGTRGRLVDLYSSHIITSTYSKWEWQRPLLLYELVLDHPALSKSKPENYACGKSIRPIPVVQTSWISTSVTQSNGTIILEPNEVVSITKL